MEKFHWIALLLLHLNGHVMKGDVVAAGSCIERCTQELTTAVLEFGEISGGAISPRLYERSGFEEFCGVSTTGRQCIDRCPYHPLKQIISDALFKSFDYLCIEHRDEFVSYSDCYKEMQTEVDENCNSKCGDINTLKRLQTEQNMALQRGNFLKVKTTFSKICRYSDCHLSCMGPIIKRRCNDTAPADLLIDMNRISAKQGQGVLRSAGGLQYFPQECADLAEGKVSVTPNGRILKQFMFHTSGKTTATSSAMMFVILCVYHVLLQ